MRGGGYRRFNLNVHVGSPQPLVVLEALAAGLAIISTRYRGIPETARDGPEALLVEPGDTEALSRALRLSRPAGG